MTPKLKQIACDAAMVVLFLIISFAYFQTPITQDLTLSGHDTDAAMSQGREQTDYRERHDGETSRWTNAMFSGMPTFQIAPSYDATQTLGHVSAFYNLGTHGVLCYVFAYLLGFYILLRAFNFRPYLAALGAIVWAFSSYFFIIIAAGHIWKVMTLAYIPPTIAGLVLCYRGRLLWGSAVTAIFTAFQVLSNHVQMTYYFLFVMFLIVVCYGIASLRRKGTLDKSEDGIIPSPSRWLRATGCIIIAGLLGVCANLPNLYHTYSYAEHTMRGGSELTPLKSATADKGEEETATQNATGLTFDYITQWSYGVDETLTLLVPNFKGGGTKAAITEENVYDEPYSTVYGYCSQVMEYYKSHPEEAASLRSIPGQDEYWGDQPFTVGPVYVGAFIVFLFILGLFIVRGPMKWALAAATVLSLLIAWGHNLPWFTQFLIDHLPMYNKFRTVSSALVIAEFTMPLLAIMALAKVLRDRSLWSTRREKIGLTVATILTAGVCLVLWIAPTAFGSLFSADEVQAFDQFAKSGAFGASFLDDYAAAVTGMRSSVLSASAGRSLLIILVCGGALVAACMMKRLAGWIVCAIIGVVCLGDMWTINRQYLNDDNFREQEYVEQQIAKKTPADEQILQDKDLDYRVLSFAVSAPFSENSTSYWHKNIGGYHAAKLQRYQDLIDRHLQPEQMAVAQALQKMQTATDSIDFAHLCPTLNMLNARYFILSSDFAFRNPAALGNGWFVQKLQFVADADHEMGALDSLDTRSEAVADKQFAAALDGSPLGEGSVKLTAYEPNELHYDVETTKGGVAVFSEVFYPGWTATVDGQEVEVGRVNYVLRAIKVPAGKHKVVFEFRPTSVTATNAIAYAALAIIIVLFLAGAFVGLRRWKKA